MDLWVIFLTGLTVGGLTCLAVQGGLLASVIAAREEEEVEKKVNTKNPVRPTLAFLAAKLVAYTFLGGLLGGFGGLIGINETTQTMMQGAAGLYMIAIALNLLNVHPIFRYAVIQPPKFLIRKVRSQSKSKDLFAPAFLGAMTIFIPCGTTLAMEALAISSANALVGAAIMATFVLGTSPLFFGIGWLTSILGDTFRTKFLKIAAIGVLYLGIMSFNGALIAGGSPVSLQSTWQGLAKILFVQTNLQNSSFEPDIVNGVQNVQIAITASGYNPRYIKVKKGTPVRLTLTSKDAYSCASAFRIPSLGFAKNLPANGTETFTFTPNQAGQIAFTCSMGMYTGVIEVL